MSDIIDFDLAVDVKSFIRGSHDVIITDSNKNFILTSGDNDILMVTKTIDSPTKIISVVKVTPDYLRDNIIKPLS